jgi:hypothetical protein
LLGSTNGAQRASLRGPRAPSAIRSRSLAGAVVAAALLASALAAQAEASYRPTGQLSSGATIEATGIVRPWFSEEQYAFYLTNCIRTGGLVLSDGTCRGYGSGRYSAYVAPLLYAPGMSDKVSRPYARLIAIRNVCSHFYGGSPYDRILRAGYTWITNWGENIGCRTNSTVKASVLGSYLFFQSEKSSNGGHWRNIKNPKFNVVAIGVWQSGARNRLVVDFVTSH